MKVLIFDTETTGLPNKKDPRLEKQPYIVQFAGIIIEINQKGEYSKIDEINIIIDPEVKIPMFASQIHNIYNIDVKGKPKIAEIIPEIIKKINSVDMIVAHNIKFDKTILQTQIERLRLKGINIDFTPKKEYCTMTNTVWICRLPRKKGNWYKIPKLMELYKHLFKQHFTWAHDAMIDVKATARCFVRLVEIWFIKLNQEKKDQQNLF